MNFNVDKFLAMEKFHPDKVWRKGEARVPSKPPFPNNQDSGFNVVVSRESFANIETQVTDAIAFLNANYSVIEDLRNFGAEDLILDFGEAWPDHVAHFDRFPKELVSLAGRLGLGLKVSHYVTSNE